MPNGWETRLVKARHLNRVFRTKEFVMALSGPTHAQDPLVERRQSSFIWGVVVMRNN